ncbi:MAG: carboxymuconolactone decarboxylase family protein [Methanobacteriaceae archaeon]|jgi:4-carboxymuconolactone decarboxylase|nr:carboxymuconolactone decarboxylase family protein [Methanobacteriaceae archaeon]
MSDRYRKGIETLEIMNKDAIKILMESLDDTAPDLANFVIKFAYGEVYTRKALDLKSREIATVAALTAMGNAPEQLKDHINGALNVGCSREEIVEVIIQMTLYAGFPAAINGIMAAKEVFKKLDEK